MQPEYKARQALKAPPVLEPRAQLAPQVPLELAEPRAYKAPLVPEPPELRALLASALLALQEQLELAQQVQLELRERLALV